ncbi:MAG: DUF2267 domain-containing protein [Anaerolineae bacterium]|jgi:hypothetical protein|nr:DUF2267 domain-containing protein [Anaerolineae bacterium]
MQELVDLVAKKTGLSKEMSKTVVDVVLNFIKKKLPAPAAAQVDALISGQGAGVIGALGDALDDGKLDASDAANLLGGLLGGKK